ncbi:MAG: hypothetical protein ACI9SP_004717 [Arenicella sp.]|jgi:hypothetical protein
MDTRFNWTGIKTFDYYSLAYLNQWLEKDRYFFEELNSDRKEDERLLALKRGATFYRIARNLKTPQSVKSGDIQRYKAVLASLDSITIEQAQSSPIETISLFNESLKKSYGESNRISASSKFLWMKFRSPFYIYDALSREALGTKHNRLDDFFSSWNESFLKKEPEIVVACSNLNRAFRYSCDSRISAEAINKLSSEPWFLERVHDLYLMDVAREKLRKK